MRAVAVMMTLALLAPSLLPGARADRALAAEPLVVSEPDGRQTLELTVYNQDLALIREVRRVDVPRGACEVELRGVPAKIRPQTLLVESGGGPGLVIREQNYEFDLMSREKILEKYVGRELAWIQEDGERVTGRLLGIAAGPVFQVDGEILFEVPGRIALPRLPENLRARPTLVWRAETDRAGDAELDVSYLTRGLSWAADYVLQLDPAGAEADLKGWVTVENRSGTGFAGATLQLVAGEVHQVREAMRRPRMLADGAKGMTAAPQVEQEALYDYHLYTVPWTTDLPDNSSKQVSLLEAAGIAVERRYTVRAGSQYFRGGPREDRQDVSVSYHFVNREGNDLGVPLPAGVVRVYGQSDAGKRQLLGEDRIGHTPQGEEVGLEVGKAFDLVAERVREDYRRVSDRVHQTTWQITLRNRKTEDVTIAVHERVGGEWQILRSSRSHEKLSAAEIRFTVPVPADGESVLTYTVQVTY
jgi:hypothetical protein